MACFLFLIFFNFYFFPFFGGGGRGGWGRRTFSPTFEYLVFQESKILLISFTGQPMHTAKRTFSSWSISFSLGDRFNPVLPLPFTEYKHGKSDVFLLAITNQRPLVSPSTFKWWNSIKVPRFKVWWNKCNHLTLLMYTTMLMWFFCFVLFCFVFLNSIYLRLLLW